GGGGGGGPRGGGGGARPAATGSPAPGRPRPGGAGGRRPGGPRRRRPCPRLWTPTREPAQAGPAPAARCTGGASVHRAAEAAPAEHQLAAHLADPAGAEAELAGDVAGALPGHQLV